MRTKTIHEETILKEVQGMSQPVQEKLAKVIRFFKQEIIAPGLDEKRATDEFLSVCGTWEDDRTIEEQIKDIYSSRKSTTRTEDMF